MRRLVLVAFTCAVAAMVPLAGQRGLPAASPDYGPPQGWPERQPTLDLGLSPAVAAAAADDDADKPLTAPSINQPFEIGAALHDPNRVDDAVVSMLSLMGIEIVPEAPPTRAGIGAGRLRLPESEVRSLIAMGEADAGAQQQEARGRGDVTSENGVVSVLAHGQDIAERIYDIPPAARATIWGEAFIRPSRATIEWHAVEMLDIFISNVFKVGSTVGSFGLARAGMDVSFGTLAMGDDGTYRGVVWLEAESSIALPGKACAPFGKSAQRAVVIGTPSTETDSPGQRTGAFYNEVHRKGDSRWRVGQPNAYLRLEFFPTTAPVTLTPDPCQDEIGGPQSPSLSRGGAAVPFQRTPNFIPLNDAQWTVEHTGYAIAMPATGVLRYEDHASDNPQTTLGVAESVWYVSVTRRKSS